MVLLACLLLLTDGVQVNRPIRSMRGRSCDKWGPLITACSSFRVSFICPMDSHGPSSCGCVGVGLRMRSCSAVNPNVADESCNELFVRLLGSGGHSLCCSHSDPLQKICVDPAATVVCDCCHGVLLVYMSPSMRPLSDRRTVSTSRAMDLGTGP